MTTTIIWTALPNGMRDEESENGTRRLLKLSVLVSPRLRTDGGTGQLSQFQIFRHWPAFLGTLQFRVRFSTAANAEHDLGADVVPQAQADKWDAIFKDETLVRSFTFDDHTSTTVHSCSSAALGNFLADQYAKVAATNPTGHPTLLADSPGYNDDLFQLVGSQSALLDEGTRNEIYEFDLKPSIVTPAGWADGTGAIPTSQSDDPAQNFELNTVLWNDFHQLSGNGVVQSAAPPDDDLELDFHQMCTSAGQYPVLMSALGLVVDLELDVTDVDVPFSEITGVTILEPTPPPNPSDQPGPDQPSEQPLSFSPITRCTISEGSFATVPRNASMYVDGFLPVTEANGFTPLVVDADGAALRWFGMVQTLNAGLTAPDTTKDAALPTLRSGGIALEQSNKAVAFVNQLALAVQNNAALESSNPPILFAEDLVRGLRADVFDEQDARWDTLMRRSGDYTLGLANGQSPTIPDADSEGYASTAPTGAFDDLPGHLYLPETVFGWDGWSLAVERPGQVVGVDEMVEDVDPAPRADFPVDASFDVFLGSLPILRYGRRYRLRARYADLAGNGPRRNGAAPEGVTTEPILFGRHEPIASPTVLLGIPRGEGEGVHRLVIYNNNIDDDSPDPRPSVRHLAPPKTSVAMAELHGKLDRVGPDGRTGPDPERYDVLVKRDRGGFWIPGTTTGNPDLTPHPDARSDPNDYEGTFYYPVPAVTLNYLPDPVARGAAVRILPGPLADPIDELWHADFSPPPDEVWPNARPVLLVAHGTPGANGFDASSRHMNIHVGPSEVLEARVSCFMNDDDTDSFMLTHMLRELDTAEAQKALREVPLGRHWMFTPYQVLTIVHAVRRPLRAPEHVGESAVEREKDQTWADIFAEFAFHRRSTSRVDFHADWDEPFDVPWQGPPGERHVHQVPFTISADRSGFDLKIIIQDRQEFGDTKHRVVTYEGDAITRFAEYFVEHETLEPPNTQIRMAAPLVRGSVAVRSFDGQTVLSEGTNYTVRYDLGLVTLNEPPTQPMDVAFIREPINRRTAQLPLTLSIPSTSRPAPPKVLYAVPAFQWERTVDETGTVIRSKGKGNTLRIFLDRPWWSSGEGELLGVALLRKPLPDTHPVPDQAAHVSTLWGLDPVFEGPGLPDQWPFPVQFPAAEHSGFVLTVPEAPGVQLNVAGHKVEYDEERDLWFSDVEVDVDRAYTPFIRLALCRYQPDSLPGVELSQIVLAQFAQLRPGRMLTVSPGSSATHRKVVLAGDSYTGTSYTKPRSFVSPYGSARVTVEKRDASIADPDLGWEQFGKTVQLGLPSGRTAGAVWIGEVNVGSLLRPTRLVVEQFEELDAETQDVPPKLQNSSKFRRVERLVYQDIVQL